jgi:hypothetical protein
MENALAQLKVEEKKGEESRGEKSRMKNEVTPSPPPDPIPPKDLAAHSPGNEDTKSPGRP